MIFWDRWHQHRGSKARILHSSHGSTCTNTLVPKRTLCTGTTVAAKRIRAILPPLEGRTPMAPFSGESTMHACLQMKRCHDTANQFTQRQKLCTRGVAAAAAAGGTLVPEHTKCTAAAHHLAPEQPRHPMAPWIQSAKTLPILEARTPRITSPILGTNLEVECTNTTNKACCTNPKRTINPPILHMVQCLYANRCCWFLVPRYHFEEPSLIIDYHYSTLVGTSKDHGHTHTVQVLYNM